MPLRVMIVDDSPVMRTFIQRVVDLCGLEISGYVQAADGAEALRLLAGEAVDVILTDINMPDMDGEEFVRRLGEDPVLRKVPVLVISTDGTESRMQTMLELGARGYVSKPFSPEALRRKLSQALEAKHV